MKKPRLHLSEVKLAAAGMVGRGATYATIQKRLGPHPRTLGRWMASDPDFRAEVERVRASAAQPDPWGTLLDALSARRDDGVDWPARVRAAQLLIGNPRPEPPPPAGVRKITAFVDPDDLPDA
jgi:hypothetical protein